MATILITSPFGAQGSSIAKAFIDQGHNVRGVTRSSGPRDAAYTVFTGDLTDSGSLSKACDGVDTIVFTSPLDYRPGIREKMASNIARSAERHGIGRIVLNTAAPAIAAIDRPVFSVLRELRLILGASSVPLVTVEPTVYMDNIIADWSWNAITEHGVLPYPANPDLPIPWISHRTLAQSIVSAATLADIEGRTFMLGGKSTTTVAFDFAVVMLDDDTPLHVYGMPGQEYFAFMRRILLEGAIGVVLVLDGSVSDLGSECLAWLASLTENDGPEHIVIGINKTDLAPHFSLAEVRSAVRKSRRVIPVFTFDARDREQTTHLLRALLISMVA